MPRAIRDILTNREVIAVNQDALGVQGWAYESTPGGLEIWFKPLANGDWAMAVLNRAETPRRLNFDFAHHWVSDGHSKRETRFGETTYRIRDLWAKGDIGTTARPLVATVPSHDALMFRLTMTQP